MRLIRMPAVALVVVFSLVACAIPLSGSQEPSSSPSGSVDQSAGLQSELDEIAKAGGVGVQAYWIHEKGTWSGAAGLADIERRTPMRPEHRTRIGSTTKSLVSALVLSLVAEGKLTLEDTVQHWLPGVLQHNADKITVRMLLQHTAGLYEYTSEVAVGPAKACATRYTPQDLVDVANRKGPQYEPGSKGDYNNTGYILAGMIVEKVTGSPLGDELVERVFDPAGMRTASFPVDTPDIPEPYARGYLSVSPPRDITRCLPGWGWAAGAAVATAEDLARFSHTLANGRLIPQAQLIDMHKTRPVSFLGEGATPYGLGLYSSPTTCGVTSWGHGGNHFGYDAYFSSTADGKRTVAIVVNRDHYDENFIEAPHVRAVLKALDRALCRPPR